MIKGNERLKKIIKNSVVNKKYSHAYIIDGEEGLGKSLITNYFAKAIQCKENKDQPCNICKSCKSFNSKNNIDVFYISPTKKTLGVEVLREKVIKNLLATPYENKYKIYIIDRCEKMTVMAQNLILKSIEEPPSHTIFFLMNRNSDSFLDTVKSRCITLKCKEVSKDEVISYLINIGVEKNKALEVANLSEGNIGTSLKILKDEELQNERDEVITIIVSLDKINMIETFRVAKLFKEFNTDIQKILDFIIFFYRDIIIYKKTKLDKYIIQKDKEEIIKEEAEKFTLKNLYQKVDSIITGKRQLNNNCNPSLTIELMLLKIKEK